MSSRAKAFWGPIASALLLLLAFPPLDLRFLVFVGLIPWLVAMREWTPKQGWKGGLRFGLVFMLGQLFFVQMLTARWTGSFSLSLVPWLIGGFLGSLYFGVVGWLLRRTPYWAAPLTWAFVELFRSYLPVFAFPWGLIATPLWPYPVLLTWAAGFTIFGMGAFIVLVNQAVLALIRKDATARFYAMGSGLAFAFAFIGYVFPAKRAGSPRNVYLCQPGVDLAFGDQAIVPGQTIASANDLLREAAGGGADLAILPEGIARMGAGTLSPFDIPHGLPVVFGAQRGLEVPYQSAFSFDGSWHIADKTRLVIFGEFVPARSYLPFLSAFNLPTADIQAGDKVAALPAGRTLVGPVICFESLFPDIAYRQVLNGAQILAVVSEDDWFLGTPAAEQLKATVVFLAAESDIPTVQVAVNGPTLALDSRGKVLVDVPLSTKVAAPVTLHVGEDAWSRRFVLWWQCFILSWPLLIAWKFPRVAKSAPSP